jgi:predicted nucleic acid-binding protein
MKPRIYLETTVVSYLSARPSRDLVTAAHQHVTKEWWQTRRGDFELFVSQIVIQESSGGDADAAARRLDFPRDIPSLELTEDAITFSEELVGRLPLPGRALLDAVHIALAVVHGMDYLLTWNCAHIANAVLRNRIESVCHSKGYAAPVICTPEELLQG